MKKISANSVAAPVLALLQLVLSSFARPSYAQRTARRGRGSTNKKFGSVDVESIVRTVVAFRFAKDPTLVAALLRVQFHDCFVHMPGSRPVCRYHRYGYKRCSGAGAGESPIIISLLYMDYPSHHLCVCKLISYVIKMSVGRLLDRAGERRKVCGASRKAGREDIVGEES